jgi:hypothetical protein
MLQFLRERHAGCASYWWQKSVRLYINLEREMAVFPEVDYAKQRGELVNPAYDYSAMSNPPTTSTTSMGGFTSPAPGYTSTYSSGGSSSSGSGAGAFVILVVFCCVFGASGILYFFGTGFALILFCLACSLLFALVQFGWEVLKWIFSWKGLVLGTVLVGFGVYGEYAKKPDKRPDIQNQNVKAPGRAPAGHQPSQEASVYSIKRVPVQPTQNDYPVPPASPVAERIAPTETVALPPIATQTPNQLVREPSSDQSPFPDAGRPSTTD